MDGEQKLRAIVGVAGIACIGAITITAIITIAPRVSPDVAQQQRVTAPWLSGERR